MGGVGGLVGAVLGGVGGVGDWVSAALLGCEGGFCACGGACCSFGLTVPGAAATFKIYAMTATGNERGSNAVTVTRPPE